MLKLKLNPEKRPSPSDEEDPISKAPTTKIKVKKPRKTKADKVTKKTGDTSISSASLLSESNASIVNHYHIPRLSLSLKSSGGGGGDGSNGRITKTSLSSTTKKKRSGIPKIRVKAARKPGDGYDSEAPDREEDPVIEEAVVLRMLPGDHLDYLRAACEQGDLSKISIKFKDSRRAVITIHDQLFAAQLVDLPTITEAQKSFDRKNIYKSADVCQMLLVTEPIEVEDEVFTIKQLPQQFPNGLTAPMYQARKRRFRKRISNKTIESVEARVDELFRLDEEAEESRYDLLNPNTLSSNSASGVGTSLATLSAPVSVVNNQDRIEGSSEPSTPFDMLGGATISGDEGIGGGEDGVEEEDDDEDLLGLELERALQEDEGEEEEENDFEERRGKGSEGVAVATIGGNSDSIKNSDVTNLIKKTDISKKGTDIAGSNLSGVINPGTPAEGDEDEEEYDEDEEEESDEEDDGEDGDGEDGEDGDDDDEDRDDMDENQIEAMYHSQLLKEEISELESTIATKQRDAENTMNQIMRGRLLGIVGKLRQELEMKKRLLNTTTSTNADNNGAIGEEIASKDENDDDRDADADGDDDVDDDDVEGLF